VGGGSNFGGIALPYVRDKIAGKNVRIIAAEPAACPSLTRGVFAYDLADTAGMAPLMPMHTLGHNFVPAGIHAGGLRYHGMSPIISQLYNDGLIEVRAYPQLAVFDAAVQFARNEGIIPAPEPAHAIRAVVDEALRCKEEARQETILFNLCGHGNFDMAAYDAYFSGKLEDYELPQAEIQRALRDIEGMPVPAKA
jgi:tryptophan synthase beta chain